MTGTLLTLDTVWAMADITMALMTLCNIIAILLLGKYARRALVDYRRQLKEGKDPQYSADTIPEADTPCWPDSLS